MRHMVLFPFRFLFFTGTRILKIVGLIVSFGFRALRFAVSRPIMVALAAIAGFFIGSGRLRGKSRTEKGASKGNG